MKNLEQEGIAKEFGALIQEARKCKGLTQEEVAQKVGISRGYYALVEEGRRDIYFTTAAIICEVLDLNLNINDFTKRMR